MATGGVPQPKGSFGVARGRLFATNQSKLGPWVKQVQEAAERAIQGHPDWEGPMEGPILVENLFLFPPRKTDLRTNGQPKRWPIVKTSKPDLDKLERAIHDAYTAARVWGDDAQVIACTSWKGYGLDPGCYSRISTLTEDGIEALWRQISRLAP